MFVKAVLVVLGFASMAVAVLDFEKEALSLRSEQYKCMEHCLDLLSHSRGVERLYAQYQPELRNLIKLRIECAEKNVLKRKVCEVSRGVKILEKMSQYADAANAKSPKFRDQYLADAKICK